MDTNFLSLNILAISASIWFQANLLGNARQTFICEEFLNAGYSSLFS